MNCETYTLTNGLTILLVDTLSFETATTLLLVNTGSRYETLANNGVAHFFEHMAFKGSKKYPSSFTIASTIESFGGVFNAFTSKERTGYWIKAPLEHIDTSLSVISDMIQNPLLLQDEVQKERGVILEEMNMYEDTPSNKVSEIFEQNRYASCGLGMDIIGTKETLLTINSDTIRNFINAHYSPKNSILVIAGGINNKKTNIKDAIKNLFLGWENKDIIQIDTYRGQGQRHSFLYKPIQQAHLVLGYECPSAISKDANTLTLLSIILGGGMSSRLFSEIREKRGLCYYIGSSHDGYNDLGTFTTQVGLTIEKDKINEAFHAIVKEHEKIAREGILEEELNRAKDLLKGRLMLQMENSYTVASYFGSEYLLKGRVFTPQDFTNEIQNITLEEIQKVANLYFTKQNLYTAIVGPYKEHILNV